MFAVVDRPSGSRSLYPTRISLYRLAAFQYKPEQCPRLRPLVPPQDRAMGVGANVQNHRFDTFKTPVNKYTYRSYEQSSSADVYERWLRRKGHSQ